MTRALPLAFTILLFGSAGEARGQTATQAKPPKGWQFRVPLDSGQVLIQVNEAAASVAVIAPTGTFQQAFETPLPVSDWADMAEMLPVPEAVRDSSGRRGQVRFSSTTLTNPKTEKTPFDSNTFHLTRLDSSATPAYELTGSNGAWSFSLFVEPAQGAALLAALRGDSTSGVFSYGYPEHSAGRGPGKPMVTGAWLQIQVDRQVEVGERPPSARYPKELLRTGTAGVVRLAFIVDSTGLVRPSSIRLIGRAHPSLAAAARTALLGARYRPAMIDGKPVAQQSMQDFEFHP